MSIEIKTLIDGQMESKFIVERFQKVEQDIKDIQEKLELSDERLDKVDKIQDEILKTLENVKETLHAMTNIKVVNGKEKTITFFDFVQVIYDSTSWMRDFSTVHKLCKKWKIYYIVIGLIGYDIYGQTVIGILKNIVKWLSGV